jgi:hypothetical protein
VHGLFQAVYLNIGFTSNRASGGMNTGNAASVHLPSPLPRRAVPNPDEDLLSLLRRTAARMGYPDYRWLLRPEGKGWDIKDTGLPILSGKYDYQILEH